MFLFPNNDCVSFLVTHRPSISQKMTFWYYAQAYWHRVWPWFRFLIITQCILVGGVDTQRAYLLGDPNHPNQPRWVNFRFRLWLWKCERGFIKMGHQHHWCDDLMSHLMEGCTSTRPSMSGMGMRRIWPPTPIWPAMRSSNGCDVF